MIKITFFFSCFLLAFGFSAQVIINEGCNKNFQTIVDEDGDSPDWIELFNGSSENIQLSNYFLTDNPSNPFAWQLPNVSLAPSEFQTVFCSEKNRLGSNAFNFLANQQAFAPVTGWNQHNFSTPFIWDGVSNIILNVMQNSKVVHQGQSFGIGICLFCLHRTVQLSHWE